MGKDNRVNYKSFTTDKFKERVLERVGSEYTVVGTYVNAKTKIEMLHNECKTLYEVRPDDFIRGRRCPKCAKTKRGLSRRITNETFLERVDKLVGAEYTFNEPYQTWETKISVTHNSCGYTYKVVPNSFLCGKRCPKCKCSHGENIIENILKANQIAYEKHKSFTGLIGLGHRPLSYDFYLPQYNLLIEYHGKQHYEPIKLFGGLENFNKQKEHDARKESYAKFKNINLMVISYKATNEEKIRKELEKVLTLTV